MRTQANFEGINRPATEEEDRLLTEAIKDDGLTEPIVLYNDTDIVVDGHRRLRIVRSMGWADEEIPTQNLDFADEDAAIQWAIRQQLARRNLSRADFKLALGKLYNQQKKPAHRPAENKRRQNDATEKPPEKPPSRTRDALAAEHYVSPKTVERAGDLAAAHEKLVEPAKILYHDKKLTDAQVELLATKPQDEQTEIATKIRKRQATADELLPTAKPRKKAAAKNGKADLEALPLWQQFAAKHAEALNHLTSAISAVNWIDKHGKEAAYLAPVITRIKTDYRQLRGTISANCPTGLKKDGTIRTKVMERK